jgi:hypothetical protein
LHFERSHGSLEHFFRGVSASVLQLPKEDLNPILLPFFRPLHQDFAGIIASNAGQLVCGRAFLWQDFAG